MALAKAQSRPAERRLPGPVTNPPIPEIVAELSGNHGGKMSNALRLISEAKRAGADAVKFQCFEPEALAAKRVGITWHGQRMDYANLLSLYQKTHTPKGWFPLMIARCEYLGIEWLASAFSPDDVAFLETVGCPRYKISAYEMLDGDLINAVVATGKPIIMSVRSTDRVTVLEATDYDGNTSLGLSDHSHAVFPTWKGRPMIERHIMLDDVPNEDEEFSSNPEEFARYVEMVRS